MAFVWNDESIGWFATASQFTGFHRQLARLIRPYLQKNFTLCDIGCGLGRLDIELAPYVQRITAVDTEPKVLRRLQAQARQQGIQNIDTLCKDATGLQTPHDVYVMSFFGRDTQGMAQYFPHCRNMLVRVVNAANAGNLYPASRRTRQKSTIPLVQSQLQQTGLPYKLIQTTIEFGQPFKNLQDAAAFVQHQASAATPAETQAFLAHNLCATSLPGFAYYLPNPKQVGIFMVNTSAAFAP